ncbi:NAD-dependent epimerase/dehydratase family protein [Streptococcus sp. S784/96/1]|uniref:NAD-dependent epimerase/dehydratase family protein n=1 Tax=Streptococcus sp. S784/96/1 TaxID=2653499 RepID=UPI0013866955|nr:NAD-dependent epimerase/dehydratase family protein [Streptococcus sp. S784/96/1]
MTDNRLYLVTDGAGFLGSTVCRQLLNEGKKVRTLVLPNDKSAKYLEDGIDIIYGDLCDVASLEEFFSVPNGVDTVVIHVASMVTVNPDFSQKLLDVNVQGTQNIINKCLEHPECQKLVYVGSTGAIPELPHGQKITEISTYHTERLIGWYSKSKAMATQAVLDACHKNGLQATIVQPSGIMGPGDYAIGEITGTIAKILKGELPVGMSGSFNLCDVRDLADGCIRAVDKGKIGDTYILANEVITFKDMCRALEKEVGAKAVRFFIPLWLSKKMATTMEKRAEKTGEKPLITSFSVYNLEKNNAFDYSKAKRVLGYQTRPYQETIRDMGIWMKQQGLV